MNGDQYDESYYERGVETRVSGYQNYRWLPHYVLPLANALKWRYLRPDSKSETVLDFGCAKGFLVKAFRLLGVEAYGFDISLYAITNCDPAVTPFVYCRLPPHQKFSLVVAKDTLEHVSYQAIDDTLLTIRRLTDRTCVVTVPLGDIIPGGKAKLYRIREYELDKTHVIREDECWWIERFNQAGFRVEEFHYDFPGAKEHWLKVHPHGNATFVLSPRE